MSVGFMVMSVSYALTRSNLASKEINSGFGCRGGNVIQGSIFIGHLKCMREEIMSQQIAKLIEPHNSRQLFPHIAAFSSG